MGTSVSPWITVIDFPQMVSTKHFNAEVGRCRLTLSHPR